MNIDKETKKSSNNIKATKSKNPNPNRFTYIPSISLLSLINFCPFPIFSINPSSISTYQRPSIKFQAKP